MGMIGNELPHERLKRLRTEKGWTQDYVRERVGCTLKSYRNWETGAIPLSDVRFLEALADLHKVSTDYLLCRTDYTSIGNKEISEITGLSNKSIEVLRYAMRPEEETIVSNAERINKRTVSFINRVLEREQVADSIIGGRGFVNTVFGTMEDYVRSAGASVRDRRTDEQLPWITVDFDDMGSQIYAVRELIEPQYIERIRKTLNDLRDEYNAAQAAAKKGDIDNG